MSSRLGRGIGALFQENTTFSEDIQENEKIEEIELTKLKRNPFQPRKIFDEEKISELAQSIREHGVFQPIIVTKIKEGMGFYIVAGERRFKACEKLSLLTIPAIIRDIDNQTMAEIALLENLQRENLTSIEEAFAYKMLIDEYSFTQQEVADRVGKSRAHITNSLRLLSLPTEVQDMINNGTIDFGHAKVLAGLSDENLLVYLANKIIDENLSVRALEQLIKEEMGKEKKPIQEKKQIQRNVNLMYLEEKLISTLGTSTKIIEKGSGGKLVIDFNSTEDLNRLLKIMSLEDIINIVD